MNNNNHTEDLRPYRVLGLTLLQLMSLLASIGILITAILYWFFL